MSVVEIYRSKYPELASLLLMLCACALPLSISATTVFYFLACFAAIGLIDWKEKYPLLIKNPALLSFTALFCLYLIGLIHTFSPWAVAWKDLQKHHWLLLTPFLTLAVLSEHWRKKILNTFVITMVIVLILSLLKWSGLDLTSHFHHRSLPAGNVFFDHIIQSFFMVFAAFMLAYRALFFPNRYKSVWWLLVFLMSFDILFISTGRTGYILFFVSAAYLTYLKYRWKGVLMVPLASLVIITTTYFSSSSVHQRINQIPHEIMLYQNNQTITSVGIRIGMWQNTLELLKKAPLTGYGTGGIKYPMQVMLTTPQINRTGLVDHVEFSIFNFWLEFGVLGLVVFIGALVAQWLTSSRLPNPYNHFMQGFLLIFLVGGLANSFFISTCIAHLYSVIAAVCFSHFSKEPDQKILA